MSCNHCSTKFNFFHKELGCSNCGLTFCSKCLKQKCKIPSKGTNAEYSVCRTCYAKLSSNRECTETLISPPKAFIKRIEKLATDATSANQNPADSASAALASDRDKPIRERLARLRREKGVPPSESELRRRLALLKGDSNEYVVGPSSQSNFPPVDRRSDQEKTDSLLAQFLNERDIELRHDPQEEIEARLAQLRDEGVKPNEGPYVSNLHDSNDSSGSEETHRIAKKIMDEVAIETRFSVRKGPESDKSDEEEHPDELPWCVLCNADATVRCLDCGGDLYCSKCNKEVHATWEDNDHRVVPYKK